MQGKFEKNIEQQVSNFSLEPSPQIWKDVESALHSRRKNRGIVWWWIPLFGLLLAGGGWWLFNYTIVTKNRQQATAVQNKKITEPQLITNKSKPIVNIPVIIGQQENSTKETAAGKIKVDKNYSVSETLNGTEANKNIAQNKSRIVGEAAGQNEIMISSLPTGTKKRESSMDSLKTGVHEKVDSSIALNSKPFLDEELNDPAMTITASKNGIQKSKGKGKDQWLITAGIGILQVNQSSIFSANQNQNVYSSFASSTAAAGAIGGNSYQIPADANGYSLFAGVIYEHNINNRWIIHSGLKYYYLQNKQSIGVDSTGTGGSVFFAGGNISAKTNYSHQLKFPLSLGYSITPSSENNFKLLMGGSVTWVFAEKWLVTDENNTLYPYHYNGSLNNPVLVTVHTGINYNCHNHFQISLLAEQDLTPIHKQPAQKYYWQQLSLHLSKPLQRIPGKHRSSK